ncbi:MAG TPA: hypothetical protein VFT51_13000 [Bacillales bacterium]|nr:hypothetical protein [Bacillales bacterium]
MLFVRLTVDVAIEGGEAHDRFSSAVFAVRIWNVGRVYYVGKTLIDLP